MSNYQGNRQQSHQGKPQNNSAPVYQVLSWPELKDRYQKEAERLMKDFKNGSFRGLTTSKIRNLLSMVMDTYNDVVLQPELTAKDKDQIQYLIVRMAYESGRDRDVKSFVDGCGLIKYADKIEGNKENFITFTRYFESLVAYHRYYGGSD